MRLNILSIAILGLMLISCNDGEVNETDVQQDMTFQNDGHELVYNMVQKVGNYNDLLEKKDVVYNYRYETAEGQVDSITEKYIFDGESSYGAYVKHERSFADLEGLVEQGYDGSEFWLRHKGEYINDEALLKRVQFNRLTNFYWFAMMQKLLDPGINYELLSDQVVDGNDYNIVKITFEKQGDKLADIYQLYINKETQLVDQFLFTIADFGIVEEPFLMRMEYEKVEGLLIPTKRQYKKSNWNADLSDTGWINVSWLNIKFDNQLDKELFKK